MLNKKDILLKLKNLKLPKDQYCIMSGAALVLQGVKEYTGDIDIGCSEMLFNQLLKQGYKPQQLKSYEGILIDGCIEIFKGWQAEKIVYVDEEPVADLNCIRSYKVASARKKDIKDIELIDEYLKKL